MIDWCTYEYGGSTGIWSETQILKIQDTLPPVFTCPDDLLVPTSFTSCTASFTLPQPTDIQDCLPGVEVSAFGDLGSGFQYSGVLVGTYEMKYVLKDGCNNTSSCGITVTVEDATAPTPVCLEGVTIALMQGGMNELWVSDIEIGSSYDTITSPYQLAAADADQSGTLDSDDIMMLHFILWGFSLTWLTAWGGGSYRSLSFFQMIP